MLGRRLLFGTALCSCFAAAQTPTFQARTDYYGYTPTFVSLADFNNDGILDIAYLQGPEILFGNGDGTFRPGPVNDTYGGSIAIAVGDFNGDGNADLVTGDVTGTMQVGYGNGDGTFQPGVLISLPTMTPTSLAVADVNGDGLPDILASTVGGFLIFLNQGDGTFGPYTTLFEGQDVLFAAAADFNGDGLTDVVVGTGSGAQVLLGIGGGNFQNGQTLKLQYAAGSLVLADMDADGKLDLVVTGGNPIYDPVWTQVSVLKGNGDGTFAPYSHVSMPLGVYGLQVGDLNGDGTPDLAMLQNSSEYQVAVAFNRGNATFSKPVSYVSTNAADEFAMGPLRRPGVNDIVVAGNFSYFLSVLLNQGNGAFQDGKHISLSPPPGPFAPGDFNGDGLVDFAVLTSAGVSIYQNSGKGYGPFKLVSSLALTSPLWIVSADFNKDGRPDLAVTLSGGGIAVLLGQGAGQFSAPVTLASGKASMIVTGDFNNDGKVDLAATSNQIFFGNGDGTFTAANTLITGAFSQYPLLWLTPIQANQDKFTDLAVLVLPLNVNYNSFYMLLNNGNGTFRLGTSLTDACAAPCQLATADFNGDGKADLLVAGISVNYQYILQGNGDGTFETLPPLHCLVCNLTDGIATVGDFNQDGKPDIALTTGVNIAVFLGNGDGTFPDPFLVGISPGPTFLKYVEIQKTHTGPSYAFVASSGDGIDIEIQTAP